MRFLKSFAVMVLLILSSAQTQAQWRISGTNQSDNSACRLVQIVDLENSTLVYGTLTNPDDGLYPFNTIPRSTAVYVDDEPYKLLRSINLPIYDESTRLQALINGKGQKINFILEFEKFPVKNGFDIIEKESKHSEGTYNFLGIRIQPCEISDLAEYDAFLDEFPSVLYGDISEGGKSELFYIAGKLSVSCTRGEEIRAGNMNPDYYFYVTIDNGTDRDIKLDAGDNVWVTGHKGDKDNEGKKLKLMRQKDCEDHFKLMDWREARQIVAGGVTDMQKDANQMATRSQDSDVQTVLNAFSLFSEAAISGDVKKYMKEHPKEHPSMLTNSTVKPGEKLTGYVAVPTPKMDYEVLHVRLDGYEYTFKWKQ